MQTRRDFIRQSTLLTAGSMILPGFTKPASKKLDSIGLQLFSLPRLLEQDLLGTLDLIADLGFREIESFGPYPFSVEEEKKKWAQAGAMLGFSGSGFFGMDEADFKAALAERSLSVPAMHTDLPTLEQNLPALAAAARALGATYLTIPAIPDHRRQSLDDYKRCAELFNRIGKAAQEEGLVFAYHNHGYGLQPLQGEVPLELLLRDTDPDLVVFEMDIFWTTAGGLDPATLLRSHPGRYRLLHLKDMKELKRFSGDGSSAQQWFELFPLMTSLGEGVLDIEGIVKAGDEHGVVHYIVEQDLVADPQSALKLSHDYLAALEWKE